VSIKISSELFKAFTGQFSTSCQQPLRFLSWVTKSQTK
jgi:hypothetical protein